METLPPGGPTRTSAGPTTTGPCDGTEPAELARRPVEGAHAGPTPASAAGGSPTPLGRELSLPWRVAGDRPPPRGSAGPALVDAAGDGVHQRVRHGVDEERVIGQRAAALLGEAVHREAVSGGQPVGHGDP